ncbi:cGMP-dependent 3',5'-cyclic phosphodiesterase-like isoform X3 [Asterias amurensis]|uniref:cGMP-dependent 3',5'-cyclic phosphodiesterase-like isoform X3 n=1 Tax=Asterias amurensis TaxID=7602 RepID=UPI003AB1D95E
MASGTFGQIIASVFSFFRDKSWFLRWRGGDQHSDMELWDENLQDIVLKLGGVASWDQLREAIRDAVGITLDNTVDLVVYLLDSTSGKLVSHDGLAGVVHTLPKAGLAGKCLEERQLVVTKELDIEDPLSGLLPSTTPALPENRRVVCFPVVDSGNGRVVSVVVVVCNAVSSNQEKRLSLVGRHIAVCVQRLHQMATQPRLPVATTATKAPTACSGSHNGGTCAGTSYDDGILQLCADLHDNDAASMQTKVIKYLERHTQSECCALWIVSSEDATEVFCQIPFSCFNSVVTEKRSIHLEDIPETSKTELEAKMTLKIHSLLCVPVINQARSKVVAVACCINKVGAPRFTQGDEDVVRHCFRYTVPVLTSVIALQKERQLKQETQSMLQVAKNLFTHLGRLHEDVIAWSESPPILSSFDSSLDVCSPVPNLSEYLDMGIDITNTLLIKETDVDSASPSPINRYRDAIHNRSKGRLSGQARPSPYPVTSTAEDKQKRRAKRQSLKFWQEVTPSKTTSSEALADLEKDTLQALEQLGHSGYTPSSEDVSQGSPTLDPTANQSSSGASLDYHDAFDVWQDHVGETQETAFRAANDHADTRLIRASLERIDQEDPSTSDDNSDSLSDVNTIHSNEEVQHVHFSNEPMEQPHGSTDSIEHPPSALRRESVTGCSASSSHPHADWQTVLPVDSQSGAGLPRCFSSVLELDWSPGTLSVHCIDQPPSAPLQETYDVRILLREIMMEARNLTQAERCSLFLVENDELVAKVFDGHVLDEMGEVRIPITQGIAGHVATTGKILNIKDAYSHPLFYRGVDNSTGFRTRNILCFPIKDRSSESCQGGQPNCLSILHQDASTCSEFHDVVGIAELCNKVNGLYFTKHDEEVAAVFSIYCGISIVHSLLYKKMKDAQYRSKLANELMMYHMKGAEEDIKPLLSRDLVPKPEVFHPQMANFTYSPRGIPENDTIMAVISMFYDMGFVQRYRIRHSTLVNFCQLVKRGYRDPPYHNWYHAFSVGHFCFLLYKNLNQLNMLKEIEIFALLVSCICHDLDHRGTNNSFQVHSQSVLAALYSSEGSVMERHHFSQAMCILNTDGCNIFENLSRDDYQNVLDLMQDIILATDLAHHLRIIKELKQMAEDGFRTEDPHCHKLLLCLLMTSCDLSDQTKNWQTTKRIAELIYKEFFTQGDLEKAMGMETPEMYDREKACIPELQINFLNHIALPVYQILSRVFPSVTQLVDNVLANKTMWLRLKRESGLRKLSSANSIDFFQIPFKAENGGVEFGEGLSEETEEELAGEAEPGKGSKGGTVAVDEISERNNNTATSS